MSSSEKYLPEGFEALLPFVDRWAVEGTQSRVNLRIDSSEGELVAFYDTALWLAESSLDYLDRKGLASFDECDRNLMNILLSLAHVSLAVEVQKEQEPTHARFSRFMTFTRTPAGV